MLKQGPDFLFEITRADCTTKNSCAKFVSSISKPKKLPWTISPRGYKTFFLLNSAKHEISNAHKFKFSRNSAFSSSEKPRMLFFLLMNVKMPKVVGMLTFMSRKKIRAQLN